MQETLYAIALTQMQGIGVNSAKILMDNFESATAIFEADHATLCSIGRIGNIITDNAIRSEALRKAKDELEFLEKNRLDAIVLGDHRYPQRLSDCCDAPIVLFRCGNRDLNSGKFLSIVGTRRATAYGIDLTEHLVKELASTNQEITIVSGLAYGIDIAAHRAALANGLDTIGVVAHGLDKVYPSTHTSTANRMVLDGGAIVTEYPHNTRPEAHNFVQRNRIIAGMCDATVVIESAKKGGSMITARLANDYNRDVFAFPGRINDTNSQGCNRLIRDSKAQLITSADDLVSLLGWECKQPQAVQQELFSSLTSEQEAIIKAVETTPLHINQIASILNKPIQQVSATLTEMVFDDLIRQLPGDQYTIKL